MMDGTDLEGRVKHFDRFALILELDQGEQMVFKHAIAFIRSPRRVDPLQNAHS
jgi:RNA chaperone Hfq